MAVPLERGGGPGTARSHQSEALFGAELMTGFAESAPPMPLSRLTIAATLIGALGHDSLFGGAGDDRLFGGAGRDRLFGGAGDDDLRGGAGRDVLFGGPGADRLTGGRGDDRLTGGAGRDVFVFERGGGGDMVTDFAAGDLIRIVSGATTFADVVFAERPGWLRIGFDGGEIRLASLGRDDIAPDDFAFG